MDRKGRLPRQTIRADLIILSEIRCTYGTIGIKVWIYGDNLMNKYVSTN